jgi:phosphohistidine phosphatase SixA
MIVFALRHADRTDDDDLSAPGKQRAKLLARMLSESGLGVVIRSHFVRAVKTVAPLKSKLPALDVEEIRFEDADDAEDYAKKVATAVGLLEADAVVAVIGHSDTVGPTIKELGGGSIEPIGEHEFDKLFVMSITADRSVTLVKLRYGEPT